VITALVVDDEALALARLTGLLKHFDDVAIVATASNGRQALEMAHKHRPQLMLLDIEMPLLDGFDVVEEIARAGMVAPLIIFITAYPQFAAQAFETGAIDLLTKPVRRTRLEMAVERARKAIAGRSAEERLGQLNGQLEALRRERDPDVEATRYLWVHSRGAAVRVDLEAVDRVAAEGEYVRLFLGQASHLHRGSVTEMASRMNAQRFARVHRSYIVRKAAVVGVKRRATGAYQLSLECGATIPVGRSYRPALRILLDGRSSEAGA
jgi:DNA-binding LytR/AlgR family response regulator